MLTLIRISLSMMPPRPVVNSDNKKLQSKPKVSFYFQSSWLLFSPLCPAGTQKKHTHCLKRSLTLFSPSTQASFPCPPTQGARALPGCFNFFCNCLTPLFSLSECLPTLIFTYMYSINFQTPPTVFHSRKEHGDEPGQRVAQVVRNLSRRARVFNRKPSIGLWFWQ